MPSATMRKQRPRTPLSIVDAETSQRIKFEQRPTTDRKRDGGKTLEIFVASDPAAPRGAIRPRNRARETQVASIPTSGPIHRFDSARADHLEEDRVRRLVEALSATR